MSVYSVAWPAARPNSSNVNLIVGRIYMKLEYYILQLFTERWHKIQYEKREWKTAKEIEHIHQKWSDKDDYEYISLFTSSRRVEFISLFPYLFILKFNSRVFSGLNGETIFINWHNKCIIYMSQVGT